MASSSLFPTPPTITFVPEKDHCHHCHHPLKVRKTSPRKVVTLHIGTFYARQTSLICPKCRCLYQSEELAKLVAPGANFGYDVLVYVGKALFIRHRNDREVVAELAQKNVQISTREIAYLGKKFITYLAMAHQQCAGRIKEAMQLRGGYVLGVTSLPLCHLTPF